MDIRADQHTVILQLKDKKEIKLEYHEATINEAIDFLEVINERNFSLIEFVYNFIEKHGDRSMTKTEFQENVMLEFSEILEIIKKTRFAGFFDIEPEEISEKGKNYEIDQEKVLKNLKKEIGKTVAFFSINCKVDPKKVMENYSWREVIYWSNWYIYHENEETEEGRKLNRTYETKEHIEENKEYYDEEFKKLDLYLNKLNQ